MSKQKMTMIAAVAMLLSPVATVSGQMPAPAGAPAVSRDRQAASVSNVLTLARCVELAQQGHGLKAAAAAIDVAKARQGQAMSSRYPSVSASLSATRLDENPDFLFPATSMQIPAMTIQTPPMAVTIPSNAFGPGFPPANVSLPVPGSAVQLPAQPFQIPAQDITVMDKTVYSATLNATYALYTGGLAGARMAQARAGLEAARQEQRQTAAEVVHDVTRAYWGVVLAQKTRVLAAETLTQMQATLDVTESLYTAGSGRVKRTDYLRNKSMVESIRLMAQETEAQEHVARAALAMLVRWDGEREIEVADRDFPTSDGTVALAALLDHAAAHNPRLAHVQAGLDAATAGVTAASAGHLPKVGLFADLHLLGNGYSAGLVTPANKTSWAVGVGVDVPIFEGFRVVNAVQEARASRRQLDEQLARLRDGVAFEVRQAYVNLEKTRAQQKSARDAHDAAVENRDLNVRAYQDELVETKDVIEAQLMEALLAGQQLQVQFALVEARARLDLVAGQLGPVK